jgi:hypothetical protein
MRILIAINKTISFIPFQYMVAMLKEKGYQVDVIVYPKKKKYCWAEQFYLKLEKIYLPKIRHEIDTTFSAYKYDNKPLDFITSINKDAVYDYIVNFCDFFPDEIEQIKCNHKWYVSNYCTTGCYGIDTAPYVMRNIGLTPLYIIEVSDKKVVYFSESLTDFPLIVRSDTALLCKAIHVIIRYISLHNPCQNNPLSYQPALKKNDELNINGKITALHLIRILCWKLKNIFSTEQYNILIGENTKQLPPHLNLFKKIIPPKDRLWADPCIVEHDNMNHLFVEELIFAKKKGVIRCMAFKESGNINEGRVVIEKPYHLSFPFVFKYKDKYYMLPETKQNRTIELYECIEFPNKWAIKKILKKDIQAVDSFICFKNDKWWLFTNIAPGPGSSCNDELHIFYADDPVNGEWISHPSNPVVEGAGFSRNAGKLFEHQGKLYRPSQICAGYYGFGININEVIKFNVNEYEERCIYQITPSKGDVFVKFHTLDWGIKYLALDGAILLRKKLKNFIVKPN